MIPRRPRFDDRAHPVPPLRDQPGTRRIEIGAARAQSVSVNATDETMTPPPPSDPPPSATPPPARRLTRSTDDKVLSGLCGGLGRYFGLDPVIFRVAFVVLALV